METPRALVTGAYGFTGGHLAQRLIDMGWSVRGLVRGKPTHSSPAVEPHLGDLATGVGLDEAPAGVDIVFHVASVVATSSRAEAEAVIVNGTRKLAEAAARHVVKRFVHISSTAVYGHGALINADENTPRRPEDPYGEAKARAEDLLLAMHSRGDLQVTILRPRLIYGPGDRHFVPTVCDALRRRQVVLVDGGHAVNDFVHVDDLVNACVLAATSDVGGRVFNITSGESLTTREFFERVADRHALPRPRVSLPYSLAWPIAAAMTGALMLRGGHTHSYSPMKRLRLFGLPHHFSINRARLELGYEPKRKFREEMPQSK